MFWGYGFFNHIATNENESESIVQYVTQSIEWLETDKANMIKNYIKEDWLSWIVIAIISCSFIGIPLIFIIIFIEAVSLGITVSALVYSGGVAYGMSFSILIFMVPTLIKIVTIIFLLCSSWKFVENIIKYQKEIKYELIRHLLSIGITLLLQLFLMMYRAFSLSLVNQILF